MAGSKPSTRSDHDVIRIVPLLVPGNVAHPQGGIGVAAPAAHLTYRHGRLLSAVEVVTIFWGSAWQAAPQNALIDEVHQFFDFILTSALIDQLGEYDVPKYKITHGRRTGSATIATTPPRGSISDTAIRTILKQQIANRAVPKATPNTLYFFFMPPGVRVVMGGSASCQAFCGYHSAIAGTICYAVMPYPGCTGCIGVLNSFEALTSTTSHELCEAITDPVPGQGWYDDVHGEIGDICSWQTKRVGPYTVQLEWSNTANRCV